MAEVFDGGASEASTPKKAAASPLIAVNPSALSEVVVEEDAPSVVASVTPSGVKVGVAVVTIEEKSEELTEAVLAALAPYGAVPKVCKVSSALQLPAAHMQMAKAGHCDVVVAVFAMEGPMAHMIVPSVVSGLMQKASTTGVPCVHGLYHPSDVDAAAAAKLWAEDVAALTDLHRATAAADFPASTSATAAAAAAGGAPPRAKGSQTLAAAASPEEAIAAGVPPVVATCMASFKQTLKEHGARGIVGLGRKFKIADDDGSGSLNLSEFSKVISEHRLGWEAATTKAVFDFFDDDHSGTISYDEFLLGIRGELNDRRRDMVMQAYQVLDKDKNGSVDLNDIMGVYDASKHPDVIAGKKKPGEILKEFLDTFDGGDKDGEVTFTEFCHYYSNVSCSIDDDDYFELMIRNAWHISGGEGWCANSSCRRVLVTHADGTQTVEEVMNDIGMKADDKAAMKANIEAQGISVSNIETAGSVDTTKPPKAPRSAPASLAAPPRNSRFSEVHKSSVVLG
jgi:Ca2+-binding EF-hand superfamily protein/6,7-dimethyl-8-ribityllumazine synthase